MKIAHLGTQPQTEGSEVQAEEGASPAVGQTLPVYPSGAQMHLGKAELEKMGHKGPMEPGKHYDMAGTMRVMASHEDGGAHVQVTHLGASKRGKLAKDIVYGSESGE